MKRLVVGIIAASVMSLGAMAQGWKDECKSLIAKGEFAKAEAVLKQQNAPAHSPQAVVIDSLRTIMSRMKQNFRIPAAEGKALVEKVMGRSVSDADVQRWKNAKCIEYMVIDGKEMWMRKSERNFKLLNKELNPQVDMEWYGELDKYAKEAEAYKKDENNVRDRRLINITFTLDVDADAVPAGEKIKVWIPIPFENARQSDVKILKTSGKVKLSEGSVHHTAYFEKKAVKGQKTHFEINYSYVVGEQSFTQSELLNRLKPYDVEKPDYKNFIEAEYPHIPKNDKYEQLARQIVGSETNPVLQASKIYDWIAANFPWAGALDYTIIPCIPDYVLNIGHGDCGQVALLYITLCRNIGIPARWESGWMLHPGALNFHDWAETYFEGVGWVPTDVSFGRTTHGQEQNDYYKSALDVWRMAANEGVGGEFSPKKRWIRCDGVDSQAGEVEWRGGNVEDSKYSSELVVNSCERIK